MLYEYRYNGYYSKSKDKNYNDLIIVVGRHTETDDGQGCMQEGSGNKD